MGIISLLPILLAQAGAPAAGERPASAPSLLEQLDREYAGVAEKLRSAYVSVEVQRRSPPHRLLSSGTILDGEGRIIILSNGLDEAQAIVIKTADGRAFAASQYIHYPKAPVSVVQVSGPGLPAAPAVASRGALRVGDTVCIVASAYGLSATTAFGCVSGLGRRVSLVPGADLIQTTIANVRGLPGGVAGNRRGEIVGIVLGGSELNPEITQRSVRFNANNNNETDIKISTGEGGGTSPERGAAPIQGQITRNEITSFREPGVSFALPIEELIDFMRAAPPMRAVAREEALPLVGVQLNEMMDEIVRRQLRLDPREGLVVEDVIENSPARRAGLLRFDIIIRADGAPVRTNQQFRDRLIEAAARGAMKLGFVREGRICEVDVAFDAPRPPNK